LSDTLAQSDAVEQVDGRLLEHSGTHPIDHVPLAANLDRDGVDTRLLEEMTEEEACRSGTHDPNSSSSVAHRPAGKSDALDQ
jgi:hypothetical protein